LDSEHLIEFSGVILISIAEPELLTTLADFVFEYTFTGKIRGLGGDIGADMVEYGVSRFKKQLKEQVAETDEPLAILGLVTFLKRLLWDYGFQLPPSRKCRSKVLEGKRILQLNIQN
jgi:hypothetical protein